MCIEAGDLVLNPFKKKLEAVLETINAIINTVPRNTTLDVSRNFARFSKEATSRIPVIPEYMVFYIERFLLPAQIHFKIVNADKKPGESQNLAVILLFVANQFQNIYKFCQVWFL